MSVIGRLIASLLLIGLGVGGFFAMGTPTVAKRRPPRDRAPVAETMEAVDHRDGIDFEVDGIVVPYRQVEVATEVSGRVALKSEDCRTGRAVKKGELLLRIDQRDYRLEVARLTEELKQSDAFLDELTLEVENLDNQIKLTREQLDIDVRELARNVQLAATGAASQSEVDRVRRTELTTRYTLQSLMDQRSLFARREVRLEAAKALVQANLDKADLALSRTEILAPMDGIIVSDNVEQDGYVQTGNTVLTLQDSSRLDVTCKLHMRQMHWLWQSRPESTSASPGKPTSVSTQSWRAYDFPETSATVVYRLGSVAYRWDAMLNRYDGAGIDNQTRMIPCRAHVTDPLGVSGTTGSASNTGANPPTLMTGMFVKVQIKTEPPISLVRLPQRAIQPGDTVWTVLDGKLLQKPVRLAHSNREFVLAYTEQGGLQAGDRVVVSPLASPFNGLEVEERPVQ